MIFLNNLNPHIIYRKLNECTANVTSTDAVCRFLWIKSVPSATFPTNFFFLKYHFTEYTSNTCNRKSLKGRNEIGMYSTCSTYHIVTIFPGLKSMSFNWATNISKTGRLRAEPSMLMVAPSGSINRLMRGSIPLFSSTHRIVVGSVAALKKNRGK